MRDARVLAGGGCVETFLASAVRAGLARARAPADGAARAGPGHPPVARPPLPPGLVRVAECAAECLEACAAALWRSPRASADVQAAAGAAAAPGSPVRLWGWDPVRGAPRAVLSYWVPSGRPAVPASRPPLPDGASAGASEGDDGASSGSSGDDDTAALGSGRSRPALSRPPDMDAGSPPGKARAPPAPDVSTLFPASVQVDLRRLRRFGVVDAARTRVVGLTLAVEAAVTVLRLQGVLAKPT
jgi:hypothetical protein